MATQESRFEVIEAIQRLVTSEGALQVEVRSREENAPAAVGTALHSLAAGAAEATSGSPSCQGSLNRTSGYMSERCCPRAQRSSLKVS